MGKKREIKEPIELNALEQYILKYDPNLEDKSIKEMIAFRLEEDPEFKVMDPADWDLKPYGTTYALISILIKENLNQSAATLANTLALEKRVSFTSAAYVINKLLNTKHLFFYDDNFVENQIVHIWSPTVIVRKRMVC